MQDLVFPDIHCTTLDAIQSSAGASLQEPFHLTISQGLVTTLVIPCGVQYHPL
jgi:hypothetical protein